MLNDAEPYLAPPFLHGGGYWVDSIGTGPVSGFVGAAEPPEIRQHRLLGQAERALGIQEYSSVCAFSADNALDEPAKV